MTDLISKLADDLLALINAQPRSPTKEEIEELIRDRVMRWDPVNHRLRSSADADINVHRPAFGAFATTSMPLATKAEPCFSHSDCQGEWAITQEDLVKAADEICAQEDHRCPAHFDGKHYWQFNPKTQICNCACGAVGDELSDLM